MHIASSTIRRTLAAAVPVVAVGLALVGCGASASAPAAESPAPAASDAASTEPAAPAEEAQPAVGQVVSVDGWDFTVVSVGAAQEAVGSGPLSADAQGVYVPVSVTITNTANEAQLLTSDAVAIVDANGAEYSADSTAAIYDESAIEVFGEVNPGITLTGPVYFDVPDGTVPTAVTFTGALFGGETVTVAL
ncbi:MULTISPECIES: DUF4352 domain-containing protein [unclassified Agrococcus]|uniref:DUF4352 domain-containing protein n=1 Tax=unclassified Agrococcus TaxID=2615065 RepID=UPI00360E407E